MKSYYLLKEKQGFLINVERKKVKNYNIRILPDNKINCSVPIDCSDEDISKFLKEKENWIFKYSSFGVNTLILVRSKRLYFISTLLLKP